MMPKEVIRLKADGKKITGHLLALFTIIIWGGTFVASKYLLEVYSPVQVMVLRFVLAYAALWIMKPVWRRPKVREELGFLALGLFGCTFYFLAENTALTLTYASNVSIIVASAPILISLLAHFFTRDEKMHPNILWGFLIAFTGVALVVFNGTVILKLSPLGDLLSFTAALSWALYSVILKRFVREFDGIILTRKIIFYGLLTTLPALLYEKQPLDLSALKSTVLLVCVLFLGIIGSGICYITWNIAVKRLGVVATNNYIYINPFVTIVAAGILLNEPISLMSIIGAVLIILGIIICARRRGQKKGAAPALTDTDKDRPEKSSSAGRKISDD